MLNKFANWLVPKLEDWCVRTGRVHNIMGRPGPDQDSVYLIRHFLFRSKYFSVYLHRFMRSDEGDFHCHPWPFISYIVSGEYTENFRTWSSHSGDDYYLDNDTQNLRKKGTWAFRKSSATHMVLIDNKYTAEEKKKAPLTVIFRPHKLRDWGFYPNVEGKHYKKIIWWKYLGHESEPKAEFE